MRQQIIDRLGGPTEGILSGYYVRLMQKEKRDYNDRLLCEALPDKSLWLEISSADPAKIRKAVEKGDLPESVLQGTYTINANWWLQVRKINPEKEDSAK